MKALVRKITLEKIISLKLITENLRKKNKTKKYRHLKSELLFFHIGLPLIISFLFESVLQGFIRQPTQEICLMFSDSKNTMKPTQQNSDC